MKKMYIVPAIFAVELGTQHMMAESLGINKDGATINSSGDILVKEQNTSSDVNVWDEEW